MLLMSGIGLESCCCEVVAEVLVVGIVVLDCFEIWLFGFCGDVGFEAFWSRAFDWIWLCRRAAIIVQK
jgi:hypothetical protein